MRKSRLHYAFALALLVSAAGAAQDGRPIVMMTITAPGEKPLEVQAPESGLATVKVKGGEFGFRPMIQDSKPWNRVVVTVFKMDPTTEPIGQIEVKTGDPAIESKTKPNFRIAVTSVKDKP